MAPRNRRRTRRRKTKHVLVRARSLFLRHHARKVRQRLQARRQRRQVAPQRGEHRILRLQRRQLVLPRRLDRRLGSLNLRHRRSHIKTLSTRRRSETETYSSHRFSSSMLQIILTVPLQAECNYPARNSHAKLGILNLQKDRWQPSAAATSTQPTAAASESPAARCSPAQER